MALAVGTILRFVATFLGWVISACEFLADCADRRELSVSWEFAAIGAIPIYQKKPGIVAVVITVAVILAIEKGGGYSLTLAWFEAIEAGQLQGFGARTGSG